MSLRLFVHIAYQMQAAIGHPRGALLLGVYPEFAKVAAAERLEASAA